MSLPIVQIKTRNSSSVDLSAGTGGILNGLRTGELGYSYTENALFIGPKNDSDGSGASILINEAYKLTSTKWTTAANSVVLSLTFTGNAASGNAFTHNIATIPMATNSNAGVVSSQAQTFAGRKTFNTGITSKDALYLSDGTNNNITLATDGTATAKTFVGNLNYKLKANGKEFNNSAEVDLGTIGVGYGGTGKTSWTQYNIVYASNTNALGQLAAGTAGQVLSSGGTTAAPSWINCLSTNTANAVVRRDANGNFSAGTITATLSGNASSATEFSAAKSVTLTGDVNGTASSKAGWSIATTLANSGVTASSYGPSANASPAHGGTFTVPYFTVDIKGRITAASTKTITLPSHTDKYVSQSRTTTSNWRPVLSHYTHGEYGTDPGSVTNVCYYHETIAIQPSTGALKATKLHGAVWNDYAEYRTQKETIEPGYCVVSNDKGQVSKTTRKYQVCDGIVSDTFGFAIGETEECKTPLAVSGRVLAYCEGSKYDYHAGDTVCAGPNGKVIKMTREEVREWPDRIVGTVSEIPEYETWGSGNVKVNGRIWIKVK